MKPKKFYTYTFGKMPVREALMFETFKTKALAQKAWDKERKEDPKYFKNKRATFWLIQPITD